MKRIQTYDLLDLRAATGEDKLEIWRSITADISKKAERNLLERALFLKYGTTRIVGGGAPVNAVTLGYLPAAVTANTFTAAQTILHAGSVGPFSVDYFKTTGAAFEQEAMGIIGTTGTPTVAFGTYFGTAIGSITTNLCITPTITTASGLANVNWYYKAMGRTVTITGSTATMLVTGLLFGNIEVLGATTAGEPIQYAVNATPPSAVTTNLATQAFIDLQVTWGTSSVSNTITTNYYNLTAMYF